MEEISTGPELQLVRFSRAELGSGKFLPIGTKATRQARSLNVNAVFKLYSPGVNSSRDSSRLWLSTRTGWLSQLSKPARTTMRKSIGLNIRETVQNLDDFVDYSKVKWSQTLKTHLLRSDIRRTLRRAQTRRLLVPTLYTHSSSITIRLVDRPGLFKYYLPRHFPAVVTENCIVCMSGPRKPAGLRLRCHATRDRQSGLCF